jgi:nucleoside-diphosphate-sugar epimerase
MKTLVTGAPGWLGSRIVERLLATGGSVRCLVEPSQDPHALRRAGAETVPGDVRDREACERATEGIDDVVHCAGVVHPEHFADYRAIHLHGTRHLLAGAAAGGARRFYYVSSEAAQGYNTGDSPLCEDDPCRPETEYGRTKREAEIATLAANRPGELETVVIRPAMFYGPGQPERRSRLMRMVASGRPPLFGDGRNGRSMVYVENLVDAIQAARDARGIGGEIFWIADTERYTTIGFLEAMAAALGVRLRPIFLPAWLAGGSRTASRVLERLHLHSLDLHVVGESPRAFFCTNAKARRMLGWEPRVTLAAGLAETVAWWRAHAAGHAADRSLATAGSGHSSAA